MSTRGSWVTMKFRRVIDVVHASRFQSSYGGIQRNSPTISAARIESKNWMSPSLQLFSTNNSNTGTNANRVKNVKVQTEAPTSKIFTFPYWLRCVLGTVLSLILPFWKQYWEKLQRIQGEAEVVVEGVGKVAEVVEKVAMVTEKVSEDIADVLPEDSKLKKATLVVEGASKQVVHDAQVIEEFTHKVEELENGLDDLESFLEPVIDKIVKKEPQKN